jgi:hypothetical protein
MHPIRICFILAACVTLLGGTVATRVFAPPRNAVLVLFAPAGVELSDAEWADANTAAGLDRVASRTGMLGSDEVVQVRFDPRVVDETKLVATVKAMSCYRGLRPGDAKLALDPQQQHDLSMHPEYFFLPLTAMQATKVNAALGAGDNPDVLLSPMQIRLKARLAAAIANAGRTPDWLGELRPDRSESGLADYLRSLESSLAVIGE